VYEQVLAHPHMAQLAALDRADGVALTTVEVIVLAEHALRG